MPDPKGLALIIGGGKGKGPAAGGESEGDDAPPDAKVEAMRRLADALDGGDFEAAAAAFSDAYHACSMGEEETEDEPMPEMPEDPAEYD